MPDPIHAELPQSDDAERSVLGAILVDNAHLDEVTLLLRPDDFYRAKHQKIFAAMVELADGNTPIDLITLSDRLQASGALEAPDGITYLSSLMDGVPRLINVAHYAKIVRDRSVRRQLVKTAGELEIEARVGDLDIEELLGTAERRIFAIAEQRMSPGFRGMKELLEESFDAIQKRQDAGHALTGVPTGFSHFDDITSGLQAGDLIILAARPSMGKTAWALSAAQNAAIRHGRKVAIFSLEMSAMQLAMRMLFSEARVDAQLMRRGQLADRHWAKLVQAFSRLSEAKIYMDDTTGMPITEMRAKVRRLKAEHGLDLVILDYLQLASMGGRFDNRQQEISAISRSLKEMARELSLPVLALSQLSRAPDQRQGDHKPLLSDLRESGSIEQDADVVAFIFREEIWKLREGKDPGNTKGVAEIIIEKQRNGPTGTVKLAFIKEWARFENLQLEDAAHGAPPPPPMTEDVADISPLEDRAPF